MEKEEKDEKATATAEREFFLQWGNKKRLRCVRVRGPHHLSTSRIPRKTFFTLKHAFFPQPSSNLTRSTETMANRSENGKSTSVSPDRYYMTRGSPKNTVDGGGAVNQGGDENVNNGGGGGGRRGVVWPKILVNLSSKEKEEDFMAMKGCKLPTRPKKRAKVIQRTLLLVSPGAWLTDMSIERYEVREKSSKKRPRGLKAMGSIESDSE